VSKPSVVIIVVEDDHHEMLVRRYLKKRGLVEREMRIRRSPSGEGSAENWVRKTFAAEVSRYRSRHAQTALIVVIDADTVTVQHRLNQLDQALRDSGKEIVYPGRERIARLVPKRNVETWILCLNGHAVDEATDCKEKNHDWNELIPPAAETLLQWARSKAEPPHPCTDSLRKGIKELRHLIL
jgi:hypothetical protein